MGAHGTSICLFPAEVKGFVVSHGLNDTNFSKS